MQLHKAAESNISNDFKICILAGDKKIFVCNFRLPESQCFLHDLIIVIVNETLKQCMVR